MEASFVASGEGGEDAAGKPVEADTIAFNIKLTTATFTFPKPLLKGKGTLRLRFQCDINNQVGELWRRWPAQGERGGRRVGGGLKQRHG